MTPDQKSILLQKAANASSEGITISSMTDPDRPLIFVSDGFLNMTGYTRDEVIGKNCRFLQGQDTEESAVDKLRVAIANGEPCKVELLNYTKNGTPFWNRLSITPLRDDNNTITHYVGIQSDISHLRKNRERLINANKDLEMFKHRIINDLDQARKAQQFLLPDKFPASSKLSFASFFVPMDEVGGDFYNVISLQDDNYGLVIADVSGHGIPAALLTFMSSTIFSSVATTSLSTAETLSTVNMKLHGKMPEDKFLTMFYMIYNPETSILKYSQAGHPVSIVLRTSMSEIIPLSTNGSLVGPFSNEEVSFEEQEIKLIPGDKVIMYTDAVMDALDNYNSENEESRFHNFLLKNADLPLDSLFKDLYNFGLKENKLNFYSDDFTVLGFEVLG